MENTTLTTPAGHKVTLKAQFTFGDKRELERVFAEGMDVDATTGATKASGKAIYDAQDRAVELLVVKIELSDGTVIEKDFLQSIYAMAEEDGRTIYERINEMTTPTGEKKGV